MLHSDLWFMKKVSLAHLDRLPKKPGIYYAIDPWGNVRYVGMSENLHQRWNAKGQRRHHKLDELWYLNCTLKYRIVEEHRLEYEEACEITDRFRPDLNDRFPDPEKYKTLRIVIEDFFGGLSQMAGWAVLAFMLLQFSGVPMVQVFLSELADRVEEAQIR